MIPFIVAVKEHPHNSAQHDVTALGTGDLVKCLREARIRGCHDSLHSSGLMSRLPCHFS